ncbi:uncharacterized protein LOC129765734 [Toxorhynchites rutilus septentrionalis]|uniref:uncharacterized protein LOC129765734 n=1 Tax=Toxorhynchites rutilus septentrionalis TaxID=329112 RepID=UPI00247854E9|nr:uncharacterized protein LOC129765734 [Toxorhynchites rutilus septentrionalis]
MFCLLSRVLIVTSLLTVGSNSAPQTELLLHPSTPRRGRFLGLLGFLTGLTLIDSLDDSDSPKIKPPAGIVRIDIGRPFMESIYQYTYNPYLYGAVPLINIKIPLRPDSDVFNNAGFGAGDGVFGGSSGLISNHVGTDLIEPRPPTFADEPASPTAQTLEEKPRNRKIRKPQLFTSRIIRSTLRSDLAEDQLSDAAEDSNSLIQSTTTISSSPMLSDSNLTEGLGPCEEPLNLYVTAIPVIEDNSLYDQPSDIPHPYPFNAGSLRDTASISLTTIEPHDEFRPSRPDKLQNYFNSAATAINPDEFRPIITV